MFKVTVVTEFNMDHVPLSLRSDSLFHLIPLIGHLAKPLICALDVMLLHQLEATKQMSVRNLLITLHKLLNTVVICLKLLENGAIGVMDKIKSI